MGSFETVDDEPPNSSVFFWYKVSLLGFNSLVFLISSSDRETLSGTGFSSIIASKPDSNFLEDLKSLDFNFLKNDI